LSDKQGSATLAETLLAAFTAFLARITGATSFDLDFSEPSLDAEIDEFDKVFASSLPLRVEADIQRDFGSFLRSFRGELQKVRNRKTYSLDLPTRHPAFHTNGQVAESLHLPVAVRISGQSRTPLQDCPIGAELMLNISEDGTECSWFYDQNVFESEPIAALASHFTTFLESIAAQPHRPLSSVSVLSDAERHKILTEWNNTAAQIPN